MEDLIRELTYLNEKLDITGIKQSTEDEGALQSDILTMRRISERCGLILNIKIGGCEAKTDINFCDTIDSDGIVAPMIESEFALQKFVESTVDIENMKYYINIESENGYNNLNKILSSPSSKVLSGIVVGRSDLVKSYGYDKSKVDTEHINDIVEDILTQCKQYGLATLMGGNITSNSRPFIQKMYNNKLLDYIETRNVIIKLTDNNIQNISQAIDSSLSLECEWLKYKLKNGKRINDKYSNRLNQLQNRF